MDHSALTSTTAQAKSPQLLYRLGVLGVIGVVAALLRGVSWAPQVAREVCFFVAMLASVFYVTYVALLSRDWLLKPALLSSTDRWLCRWSGPLGVATAVFASQFPLVDHACSLGTEMNIQAIVFLMDVAFVLAVVCVMCGRGVQRARPVWFWKGLSILIVLSLGISVLPMFLAALMRIAAGE